MTRHPLVPVARRPYLLAVLIALIPAASPATRAAAQAPADSLAGAAGPADQAPPDSGASLAPVRLSLSPQHPTSVPGSTTATETPLLTHSLPRESRWKDNLFGGGVRYNRVEGFELHGRVSRRLNPSDYVPAYRAVLGYAFAAKRGQYLIEFEQPVLPRNALTLGASGYRSFLPFYYDDEALSGGENTASAFFLHRDYWDWYEAEGVRGFASVRPAPNLVLSAGVTSRDERSLSNHTNWSVFNQGGDFLRNPSIPDGTYRGYDLGVTYDTRPVDDDGTMESRSTWGPVEEWARIRWERGNGGLGGDYDLWKLAADVRTYFRISSNQSLATRVLAGSGDGSGGYLPPQRRFALGGMGTLHGHRFRSLQGDHAALVNLEYAFGVGGRGDLLFFADSGTAWDRGTLFDQRIPVDLGTGFRLGDAGITLLVARTVNESDAEARIFLRFRESF